MANKTNNLLDAKLPSVQVKASVAGLQFDVLTYASAVTKANIINNVLNILFKKNDDEDIELRSMILRDIAFWVFVVAGYTNIQLPEIGDSDNAVSIYEVYDIIVKSGIKDKLCEIIPYSEIKYLNVLLDNNINYAFGNYVAKHDYFNDFVFGMESLLKPNSTTLKSVKKTLEKLNG